MSKSNLPSIEEYKCFNKCKKELSGRPISSLIGNGFSIYISNRFNYKSLFDLARNDMEEGVKDLFRKLENENFEYAMNSINTAKLVVSSVVKDSPLKQGLCAELTQSYQKIRNYLISTIREVHKDCDPITLKNRDETAHMFAKIEKVLSDFRAIFTTNYDLLVYWSLFEAADKDVLEKYKDFFWCSADIYDISLAQRATAFDPSDTSLRDSNSIPVFFMHGGIHLMTNSRGQCIKIKRGNETCIITALDKFTKEDNFPWRPLFVSEGDSRYKLSYILANEYLRFAYRNFQKGTQDIVVLGHSLSKYDMHIARSLLVGNRRNILISYHTNPEPIKNNLRNAACAIRDKSLLEKIKSKRFIMFPAHTHPLFQVKRES